MEARGTFQVKVVPAEATAFEKAAGIARYEIDKQWAGDFEGTSKGEMITSFTESTGSMAYVAMEQVMVNSAEKAAASTWRTEQR